MREEMGMENLEKTTPEKEGEVLSYDRAHYQQIVSENHFEIRDEIIHELTNSIDKKFDELKPEKQKNVIQHLEDFFSALRNYKDSYDGLKYIARKERGVFYQDNVRGWQESYKNADKTEKILHDKFMDSVNILSRAMKNAGLNNQWRGHELLYNHGGANDSTDEIARSKIRQWMLRIYEEEFNSEPVETL